MYSSSPPSPSPAPSPAAHAAGLRLLAFDTSTDVLSVAVCRPSASAGSAPQVWQYSGAGGAQASRSLIATALDLLRQAQLELRGLDAIVFGCGPGAFTGLRTACAVAQGLAFGAGLNVLPVNSLLAVAEEARYQSAMNSAINNDHHHAQQGHILALLDARMDEVYTASFAFATQAHATTWTPVGESHLCRPELLRAPSGVSALAGNAWPVYAQQLGALRDNLPQAMQAPIQALPTATALLRLAPQLLAAGGAVPPDQALPLYIRNNVAQTTAERAAQAARTQPTPSA